MSTVLDGRFVRPDGLEKVTGQGRYTADLSLTGQLHAKLRYADHPHARIVRVDVSKARALPGVLAALTHEDVPDVKYGGMVQDRRLFARDKVRWEGDVVAAVAAMTPELAEQAVRLIESRQRIFLSGNCSVPQTLLAALTARARDLVGLEIVQVLTVGAADYAAPELAEHVRVNTLFISDNLRAAVNAGRADFTPCLRP